MRKCKRCPVVTATDARLGFSSKNNGLSGGLKDLAKKNRILFISALIVFIVLFVSAVSFLVLYLRLAKRIKDAENLKNHAENAENLASDVESDEESVDLNGDAHVMSDEESIKQIADSIIALKTKLEEGIANPQFNFEQGQELTAKEQEKVELAANNKQLLDQLQALEQDFVTAQQKKRDLDSKNIDLFNEENSRLTVEIDALKQNQERLTAAVEELQQQVAQLESENAVLENDFNNLTAKNASVKIEIDALAKENGDLDAECGNAEAQKAKLTETIEQVRSENVRLELKIFELKGERDYLLNYNNDAKDNKTRLENEVAALTAQSAELTAQNASVKAQKTKIEQQIGKLTAENEQLDVEITEKEQKKASAERELEVKGQEFADLTKKRDDAIQISEGLKDRKDKLTADNANLGVLSQKIDAAKTEIDQENKDIKRNISEIIGEINKNKHLIAHLEGNVATVIRHLGKDIGNTSLNNLKKALESIDENASDEKAAQLRSEFNESLDQAKKAIENAKEIVNRVAVDCVINAETVDENNGLAGEQEKKVAQECFEKKQKILGFLKAFGTLVCPWDLNSLKVSCEFNFLCERTMLDFLNRIEGFYKSESGEFDVLNLTKNQNLTNVSSEQCVILSSKEGSIEMNVADDSYANKEYGIWVKYTFKGTSQQYRHEIEFTKSLKIFWSN